MCKSSSGCLKVVCLAVKRPLVMILHAGVWMLPLKLMRATDVVQKVSRLVSRQIADLTAQAVPHNPMMCVRGVCAA